MDIAQVKMEGNESGARKARAPPFATQRSTANVHSRKNVWQLTAVGDSSDESDDNDHDDEEEEEEAEEEDHEGSSVATSCLSVIPSSQSSQSSLVSPALSQQPLLDAPPQIAILPAGANEIVGVNRHLPAVFHRLFHFESFNAVQSACFNRMTQTDQNIVVSAPTGCGKTILFELAILRLLACGGGGETRRSTPRSSISPP